MKYGIVIVVSLVFGSLYAQTPKSTETSQATPVPALAFTREAKAFRGIALGLDISSVKKLLLGDQLFNYRGEPDVMFTPDRKQTIIECTGNSYVERAYFQFNEDRLFIVTVVLDQARLDYYAMFVTLSDKYGPPASLNPNEAVWNLAGTRLSLEKPLRVKYIATAVFDKLNETGTTGKAAEDMARDKFLGEF